MNEGKNPYREFMIDEVSGTEVPNIRHKVWAGGYADIADIDAAWKIALNMSDGPFMVMDKIGLDVVYDIEMSYFQHSGIPDDKPPQALKDMIDKGLLGLKTKEGFYKHFLVFHTNIW